MISAESLSAEMDNAVKQAEAATGLAAAQMRSFPGDGDALHYYFSFAFNVPKGHSLDQVFAATRMALARVYDFINANCGRHFIRVVPEVQREQDFNTKSVKIGGFMRGTMTELNKGPASIGVRASDQLLSNMRIGAAPNMASGQAMKRPSEILAERGFLLEPRPEVLTKVNGYGRLHELGSLTIGIKIITEDGGGRKIVPTPSIVIAVSKEIGEIDLFPSTVRDLIPRLLEMCDAAEKMHPIVRKEENDG